MKIEIAEAEYRYKDGFSLEPVSFSIEPGTFMVFLGPNGSGKSTLFSLINGILRPKSGSIRIGGREVSEIPSKERARIMGMIPQTSSREFDYTVEELISMGRYPYQGLFRGLTGDDKKIVGDVIDSLDLGTFRYRSVRNLSGGEYQRVLLGRVLVQQTEILLLDEPVNHLDLRHIIMLLSSLKKLTLEGKIVVAVLHDINQAIHYGDKGLVLQNGRCITSGVPGEFLSVDLIRDVFGTEVLEYIRPDTGARIFGPA